jgi:hypothetical protein
MFSINIRIDKSLGLVKKNGVLPLSNSERLTEIILEEYNNFDKK